MVSKKRILLFCLVMVLSQGAGISTVFAETESDETIESTLSSVADDPMEGVTKNSSETTISSIPESEPSTKEDVPESEKPQSEESNEETKETETSEIKERPKPRGDVGPHAVTLIEGVDIDAKFAELLRTVPSVQDLGTSWSGYGKAKNKLTDEDMYKLKEINVASRPLTSLKGLNFSYKVQKLDCSNTSITSLVFDYKNTLINLNADNCKLTNLDLSDSASLQTVSCENNQLTKLNLEKASSLLSLKCSNNQLNELTFSKSLSNFNYLYCDNNKLTNLSLANTRMLRELDCSDNQLKTLDLKTFDDYFALVMDCSNNQLTTLDLSARPKVGKINCEQNLLSDLNLTKAGIRLKEINCSNNQLDTIQMPRVGAATNLESISAEGNKISDITIFNGFTNLTSLNVSNQELTSETPAFTGGLTNVDILKTSAKKGLSASKGTILGSPIFTSNGDIIKISNSSRRDISGRQLNFNYQSSQLSEGSPLASLKVFSGTIFFTPGSNLSTDLIPDKKKIKSGGDINWSWKINSLNEKTAEKIRAKLLLPSELALNPSSIKINGSAATLADINGTNSLGSLAKGKSIEITFTTTANGGVNTWLKPTVQLDWEDDTIARAYTEKFDGPDILITDDEQKDKPVEIGDLELISVPLSFRYGVWSIRDTAQSIKLNASSYKTNTNVVTEGFYTRIKDERTVHPGWKLTAQLSNFTDSTGTAMPNGAGTALRMEGMKLESIKDRDTPGEAINPSPTGVPSTITTDESLVAGQAAKTLISAHINEGADIWQLRMPFDKISLNLPANAGEPSKNYTATLTWSLDDTP